MQKLLQFQYPVIVDVYSAHANILSILSNYTEWLPWIYMRFLRVAYRFDDQYMEFADGYFYDPYRCRTFFTDDGRMYCLDYKNYSFLHQIDITQEFLANKTFDYIVDCINSGAYVLLFLDHYYIEGADAFNNWHRFHESIIFGYDSDSESLYMADNFSNGKYMILKVPFWQFINARESMEKVWFGNAWVRKLIFNSEIRCQFDLSYVFHALRDFFWRAEIRLILEFRATTVMAKKSMFIPSSTVNRLFWAYRKSRIP